MRSKEESDMTSIMAAPFQSVFIPMTIGPNIFPCHMFPSWEQREVCKLNVDAVPSRILLPTASKVDIFQCLPIYISFFSIKTIPNGDKSLKSGVIYAMTYTVYGLI